MILGIDVSTTCTGFSIVDEQGRLVECSFCYLSDHDNIFDKALQVRLEMIRYREKYKIQKVAIEENLTAFRRGLSSAHTIVTLARFNGIVCYLTFDTLSIKPEIIPVSDGRKSLGIRKAKKGEDAKEIVREWVENQEQNYPWPTKILRNGPRKGEVVREKGVEDAMDAYVMARACLLLKM
jgi:hypothetical protein